MPGQTSMYLDHMEDNIIVEARNKTSQYECDFHTIVIFISRD